MTEICTWSATEVAEKIKTRQVSVTEVVEAHMARLAEVNPGINAIVEVDESALQLARDLDGRTGTDRHGILYGVPVTTKINVDQAGFANSNGIPAFADVTCDRDAAVVANLKSEGAVIIGRTNTPEFSMRWCTSNPLHGVTRNPWNPDVTPGGSSGGASASIAAGIGTIAHGNDLGGSLRYPAYCCGVTSIRPSLGRVPAYNPVAVQERPPVTQLMSVQGPIARSVADLKLGIAAMSRRSSRDPLWTAASASGRQRSGRRRIGIAADPFSVQAAPQVLAAVETARSALSQAGYDIVDISPPDADRAARLWGELLFTETAELMTHTIRENGSAEMNRLLDGYLEIFGALSLREFLLGLSERRRIQRAWSAMFDKIDALVMPTSLIPPFKNDLDFEEPSRIPDIVAAQAPLFVVNLLGLPSVAIPTGLADGLPNGVQVIGPMHDDAFSLDIAEDLEREIGWDRWSDHITCKADR